MIEKNGYIIVEKGDTLGAISSKVGMSTNELQEANPAIKDINKIYVKQKIKTKPKEEEKPKEEAKAPEETAQEVHEEIKDEPVKNSEACATCCCIKTWEILEKDEKGKERNHEKIVDLKKIGKPYRLEIITPDATKDGKVTHKIITSNITKKCDKAVMTVTKGSQILTIGEDGEITIDTNGIITTKGVIKTEEELETPPNTQYLADYIRSLPPLTKEEKKRVESDLAKLISDSKKPKPDYPLAEGYIESMPCPNGYEFIGYTNVEGVYYDNRENTTVGAYVRPYSVPICNDMRKVADSDFKTILKMLTASESENTLEIKSTNKKCHKKVLIGVTPSYSVDGEMSVDFGLAYISKKKLQNKRDIIVSPFVQLTGKVTVVHGSISTEYAGNIGTGKDADGNRKETVVKQGKHKVVRKQGEHLFGSTLNSVGSFFKLFYEAKKEKQIHKNNSTWNFTVGHTQFVVKTLPGSKVLENPKGNDLDWQGEISLGASFFKDAKMEMDIIDFVITRAGSLAGFIREKREEMEHHGIKVEAMFVLESTIDFEFVWEKKAGDTLKVKKSSVAGKFALSFQSKIEATYTKGFDYVGTLEFKTTSYSDNTASTELIFSATAEVGKNNDIGYSGDIEFTGVGIYVAISVDVVKKKVEATKSASGKGGKNGQGNMGDLSTEWKQTIIKKDGTLPIIPNVSLMKDILGDKKIDKKKS